MKIKIAVIGVGYLGQYHAEKLARLPHAHLVAVCDANPELSQTVADRFSVKAITDYHTLIGQVDAVSIVVPTLLHYEIALFFLTRGIHVLVEKPVTQTLEQAAALIAIAERNKLILQVGHLERFNPAVEMMIQTVGHPSYIECRRTGPFTTRSVDVSVILDLMIHDLEIMLKIMPIPIKQIQADGAVVWSQHIDVATARIQFVNGCIAQVTASRVTQNTQRSWFLVDQGCCIDVDLHQKAIAIHSPTQGVKTKTFSTADALQDEIRDFLECILFSKQPRVSGVEARAALELAHQISDIAKQHVGKRE